MTETSDGLDPWACEWPCGVWLLLTRSGGLLWMENVSCWLCRCTSFRMRMYTSPISHENYTTDAIIEGGPCPNLSLLIPGRATYHRRGQLFFHITTKTN